jgi:hypothetical protein
MGPVHASNHFAALAVTISTHVPVSGAGQRKAKGGRMRSRTIMGAFLLVGGGVLMQASAQISPALA